MVATGSCVMHHTGQIGQRMCLNSWLFGHVRDAIGCNLLSGTAVMLKQGIIRLLPLSLYCRDFGFEAKKCSVRPVAEELEVLKELVAGLKDVKLVGQVRGQRRGRWGHSRCIHFQHLCARGQAKKCMRNTIIVGSCGKETKTCSKKLQNTVSVKMKRSFCVFTCRWSRMLRALISLIISSSLCSAGWWCFFETLLSHSKWRSYSFRSECSCVSVGLSWEQWQNKHHRPARSVGAGVARCNCVDTSCHASNTRSHANRSNRYLKIVEIMGRPVAHFWQRPEPVRLHIWVKGMFPLERNEAQSGRLAICIGAISLSAGTSHGNTRKVLLCHLQWVTAFLLRQTVALRGVRSIGSVWVHPHSATPNVNNTGKWPEPTGCFLRGARNNICCD